MKRISMLVSLFLCLVGCDPDEEKEEMFDGIAYLKLIPDGKDTMNFILPVFFKIAGQNTNRTYVFSYGSECADSLFLFSDLPCQSVSTSLSVSWDNIDDSGSFKADGGFVYSTSTAYNYFTLDSATVIVTQNSAAVLGGYVDHGYFRFFSKLIPLSFYGNLIFRVGKYNIVE